RAAAGGEGDSWLAPRGERGSITRRRLRRALQHFGQTRPSLPRLPSKRRPSATGPAGCRVVQRSAGRHAIVGSHLIGWTSALFSFRARGGLLFLPPSQQSSQSTGGVLEGGRRRSIRSAYPAAERGR